MTTADWALLISLGSLAVALSSFVWNVWSKFIYPKPRVEVGFSIMTVFDGDGRKGDSAFAFHATNFGPSEVTLQHAIADNGPKWLRRKNYSLGILSPYNSFPNNLGTSGPFSGGLPKKLAVGDQCSVYFPVTKDWIDKEGLKRFGFSDTFGRLHWCHKKHVASIKDQLSEKED